MGPGLNHGTRNHESHVEAPLGCVGSCLGAIISTAMVAVLAVFAVWFIVAAIEIVLPWLVDIVMDAVESRG